MRERRWLAALSGVALLVWTAASLTDLNHPPGSRGIRLLGMGAVAAVAALEYLRPWWGFYLFVAAWPFAGWACGILAAKVSPLFATMPPVWSGPVAAALALVYWLRIERAPRDPDAQPATRSRHDFLRIGLYVLAAAWLVAALAADIRLGNPPAGWMIEGSDGRHLLTPSPTRHLPVLLSLIYLPSALLGLLMLSVVGDPSLARAPGLRFPACGQAKSSVAAGLVILLMILYQRWRIAVDWQVREVNWFPSGPFGHYNSCGPVMVLAGVMAGILAMQRAGKARWALMACALAFGLGGYMTGSRNAVLLMLALPILAVAARPRAATVAAGAGLIAAVLLMAFVVPLPDTTTMSSVPAIRAVQALENLRAGNFSAFTSSRLGLWETAWNIFAAHPITGSGPGTFPMLAHAESPYRSALPIDVANSAHSMPVNLLAEIGVLGMIGWVLAWLIAPLIGLLRDERGKAWALLALAVGITNVLDTLWLVPGMTTVAVLVLVAWKTESQAARATPLSGF